MVDIDPGSVYAVHVDDLSLMLLDFGVFSLPINNNDESSPMDLSYLRRAATERGDQWTTEVLSWEPRDFGYHNFLSKEECEYLISLAKPHMVNSTDVDSQTGKSKESRVLKIERLDASELNLSEDSTAYTKKEFYELLKRIHEGSKATCGLKLVTLCYGIIGFLKFLGPYYKLVITERREICKVSKSEIISLQNSSVLCHIANSRDEREHAQETPLYGGPYKRLLYDA
ncbi:hypothetical protein Bca52824_024125 [Brassica carinata]|uniref:Uncharacterized protein n=1 Tax=Brassica carinata TaxID=52824 RepID=A0A8X7VK16_BRACI|nr:hypothetical protein Bca52824_024125 [Brassica carinata]